MTIKQITMTKTYDSKVDPTWKYCKRIMLEVSQIIDTYLIACNLKFQES